ncbi:LacI family DNA-binding transcriptional regulator [Microbacterium sp. UFMG61]|uniref:LacI family DNA-binding transcriptional regulator n=1 Tax=Microbacterium sp. UFMG61 TaxID=2745935 RepID=UPI0018907844|nr:LacI family DNA-binding transcriptional regulator [Microbacterium sp. UFMG61]
MARVTLADVAARVGVSAKSVSNVVNGTGWVGAEVRQRILAAIDELGYRPNLAARQLRNGRSGLIALVLPDLREPYFAEFASSFVTAAQRRALTVLIAQTDGDRDTELAMMVGDGLPALDGIVMSPLLLTAADLADRPATPPLVLIGEQAEVLVGPTVHHVGIDNVAAAAAATSTLIADGRRRIAAVGVQESGPSATSHLRFEGYLRALAAAGIAPDDSLHAPVDEFNRAAGSVAVDRLIESGARFDALFCFSDSLALGALYTLASRGIDVPTQVQVMGFDGIEEGGFHIPTFSTVGHGTEQAATTILDILADPTPSPGAHHEVPFTLIAR